MAGGRIVERCRDGALHVAHVGVAEFVEPFGGGAGHHEGGDVVQKLRRQAAGDAHFLDVFRGLDLDGHGGGKPCSGAGAGRAGNLDAAGLFKRAKAIRGWQATRPDQACLTGATGGQRHSGRHGRPKRCRQAGSCDENGMVTDSAMATPAGRACRRRCVRGRPGGASGCRKGVFRRRIFLPKIHDLSRSFGRMGRAKRALNARIPGAAAHVCRCPSAGMVPAVHKRPRTEVLPPAVSARVRRRVMERGCPFSGLFRLAGGRGWFHAGFGVWSTLYRSFLFHVSHDSPDA